MGGRICGMDVWNNERMMNECMDKMMDEWKGQMNGKRDVKEGK